MKPVPVRLNANSQYFSLGLELHDCFIGILWSPRPALRWRAIRTRGEDMEAVLTPRGWVDFGAGLSEDGEDVFPSASALVNCSAGWLEAQFGDVFEAAMASTALISILNNLESAARSGGVALPIADFVALYDIGYFEGVNE